MPMPTDPPLTPLHRDLLIAAARRCDHRLTPPERVKGGARGRLAEKLVALGVAEIVAGGEPTWGRTASGEATGLKMTAVGLAIAGTGEGAEAGNRSDGPSEPALQSKPVSVSAEPRSWTKIARVLALLRRAEGADLQALVAATGWLPHTARAALTGLRRKGHAIDAWKREADGRTVYRIPAEASPASACEPVSAPASTETAPTASVASN